MLETLLGGISGGAFGIIGALIKHGIEAWQAKQKAATDLAILQEQNRHEAAMADKHAAEIQLEADNAVKLAELARAREVDVAAMGALTASFESDKSTYSDAPQSGWMIAVDVARGMTRPALTWIFSMALIGFTGWLWHSIPAEKVTDPGFLSSTFSKLVEALIFLATSAVGWWFAARPTKKE